MFGYMTTCERRDRDNLLGAPLSLEGSISVGSTVNPKSSGQESSADTYLPLLFRLFASLVETLNVQQTLISAAEV